MADATDLAAAIGTWVAVFMAIIALGGLLPGYFIYKKSRTTQALALALVDDPSRKFVSHGFRLPGIRFNRTVRVPDLRRPPDVRALGGPPDQSRLGPRQSTTGWVNFAHVITAMFPGINTVSGSDALVFDDGQCYLPVHGHWMLVLGIVHRYAFRPDHGLPLGAVRQEVMEARNPERFVSGLSGMVLDEKRDTFLRSDKLKVFFEMHPIPLARQALVQDSIPLETLVPLALGYLRLPNGEYIAPTKRVEQAVRSRPPAEALVKRNFVTLERTECFPVDAADLRKMRLAISKATHVIIGDNVPDDLRVVSEQVWGNLSEPVLEENGYYRISARKQKRTSPGVRRTVVSTWMKRFALQGVITAYLNVEMSAAGLLYDSSGDIFVRDVLKTAGLEKTLAMAKNALAALGLSEKDRLSLQSALDAVTETDLSRISWSRHAMLTFHALDQAIQSACQTGRFMWKSTSALFSYNTGFRYALATSLESVVGGEESRTIGFDVENDHVTVPDAGRPPETGSTRFDFDFGHFTKFKPPISPADGELPLAQAAFAALRGHLRAVMWNMCLDPSGLLSLCGLKNGYTEKVIHVGTHPIAGVLDPSSPTQSLSSRSSSEPPDDDHSSDDEPPPPVPPPRSYRLPHDQPPPLWPQTNYSSYYGRGTPWNYYPPDHQPPPSGPPGSYYPADNEPPPPEPQRSYYPADNEPPPPEPQRS